MTAPLKMRLQMQLQFQRASIYPTASRGMLALLFLVLFAGIAAAKPVLPRNADITGVVADSVSGQPLASAEVSVMQGAQVIYNASTDAFGRYTAHNISPGNYTVTARFLGFRPKSLSVIVGAASADVRADFPLTPVA